MLAAAAPTFGSGEPAQTIAIARLFAYVVIGGAAAVLLYYLSTFVRSVLAEGFGYEWGYLAVGIGAAVLYGVTGVVSLVLEVAWLAAFTEGSILFFILFVALGIRATYYAADPPGGDSRLLPVWLDYLVIVGFIAAWWAGFIVGGAWTRPVVAAGWIAASVWAVAYAVQTVRVHEGTSLAALVRHLLPAVLCVVAIIVVDLLADVVAIDAAIVDAAWLVGTVLVGAFLFNTAVALRQQGGEVERMYDRTTWRQQTLEE